MLFKAGQISLTLREWDDSTYDVTNNLVAENGRKSQKYAKNVIFREMKLLRRKIDKYLLDWKNNPKRKPLIVKGARQIGKTESIRAFGDANYESVIEINFVLQKKFRAIFDDGYEVDTIIKNISLLEPSWRFIPHKTLIFFDELQKCPDCATSLKSFCQDKRYDVICSGSMMGIYYEEIESNAVGYKDDFDITISPPSRQRTTRNTRSRRLPRALATGNISGLSTG